jgi:hypothetical protein
MLAVFERDAQHALKQQPLQNSSDHTESDFVFHRVAQQCALAAVDRFRLEVVRVPPPAKWALLLSVDEIFIQREPGDERRPSLVHGQVWNGTELEDNLGADASHALAVRRYHISRERRWNQIQLHQCRLSGRHDTRQVTRIGKEREDTLQRCCHLLLGFETLAHAFISDFLVR